MRFVHQLLAGAGMSLLGGGFGDRATTTAGLVP